MKKNSLLTFIVIIFCILLSGCMTIPLKHNELKKSKSYKNSLSLSIKNKRQKKEGKDDILFLGNLRNAFGMPYAFESDKSIEDAFYNLFKNALEHTGYRIRGKRKKKIRIDILKFYCDGYVGYLLETKIRIRIYSGKKIIFSEIISKKHEFAYMIRADLLDAYDHVMNYIAKKAVKIFKSSNFKKAAK